MAKTGSHWKKAPQHSNSMPEMTDRTMSAVDAQEALDDDADDFDADLVNLLAVCEQCAER